MVMLPALGDVCLPIAVAPAGGVLVARLAAFLAVGCSCAEPFGFLLSAAHAVSARNAPHAAIHILLFVILLFVIVHLLSLAKSAIATTMPRQARGSSRPVGHSERVTVPRRT